MPRFGCSDNMKVDHCQFNSNIVGMEVDAGNATDINVVSCSFYNWDSTSAIGLYLKKTRVHKDRSMRVRVCRVCYARMRYTVMPPPHNGWGIKVVSCNQLQMWGNFCAEGSRGLLYAPTGGAISYSFQWTFIGNIFNEIKLQGSIALTSVGTSIITTPLLFTMAWTHGEGIWSSCPTEIISMIGLPPQ